MLRAQRDLSQPLTGTALIDLTIDTSFLQLKFKLLRRQQLSGPRTSHEETFLEDLR